MSDLHKSLSALAGLAAKTGAADAAIRGRAATRLSEVNAELAKVTPKAIADPAAEKRHQELMMERGRLQRVLDATRAP